jgi:ferredoxin
VAAKRIAVIGRNCVACGRCVKECPLGALSIYKGLRAEVEPQKCIGCRKCERVCPAAIIEIRERQVAGNEKKALV